MKGALLIARKELLLHLSSKRFILVSVILLATLLVGAVLIPWTMHQEARENLDPSDAESVAFEAAFHPSRSFAESLVIPVLGGLAILQILAIILASDRVCGEWQNKTLFLLLSQPVRRSGFVAGKFLGTFLVLAGLASTLFLVALLTLHGLLGSPLAMTNWLDALLGLGFLLLGIATFTALAILVSTLTRSVVISLLAALAVWILVLPFVGMAGFLVALTDDGFRKQGHFDFEGALAECGPDPRHDTYDRASGTFRTPTDLEVAAWESCWGLWQKKVDDWYDARGLSPFDAQAILQACQATNDNATPGECDRLAEQSEAEHDRAREEVLATKWDAPRVDWSRYLSPTASMSAAPSFFANHTKVSGIALFIADSPDVAPTSRAGAAAALVGQALAFLALSVLVVRRRDFD